MTRAAPVAAALDAASATTALVVDAHVPGGVGAVERWIGDGTAADHAVPVAAVDIGASLEDALALLLLGESGRVAVTDEGRHLGVLTTSGIHHALRRSVCGRRAILAARTEHHDRADWRVFAPRSPAKNPDQGGRSS